MRVTLNDGRQMTGQMLAYAGRGRLISESVDLNQVARELVGLTRATLPRGVVVRQCLAPELPAVLADGTQVRQVLLNLLTNAGEAILAAGGDGAVTGGGIIIEFFRTFSMIRAPWS